VRGHAVAPCGRPAPLTFKLVPQYALRGLASMREHDALAAFFARKDTSRYRLALEPALEAIRIDAAWIAVSALSAVPVIEYTR
jgi:hypothetical protein